MRAEQAIDRKVRMLLMGVVGGAVVEVAVCRVAVGRRRSRCDVASSKLHRPAMT